MEVRLFTTLPTTGSSASELITGAFAEVEPTGQVSADDELTRGAAEALPAIVQKAMIRAAAHPTRNAAATATRPDNRRNTPTAWPSVVRSKLLVTVRPNSFDGHYCEHCQYSIHRYQRVVGLCVSGWSLSVKPGATLRSMSSLSRRNLLPRRPSEGFPW